MKSCKYKYGKIEDKPLGVTDLAQAVLVGIFLFMAGLAGNIVSFYLAKVLS